MLKFFVIITISYRVQSKMAARQDVVTVRPKKVRFLLNGEKEWKEEEEEKEKIENVEKKFQILSLRPKNVRYITPKHFWKQNTLEKWLQDQKEGLDEEMRKRKKEEDKLKEDFVEVCDEQELDI